MKATPVQQASRDWRPIAAWVAGVAMVVWLACFQFPVAWLWTGIGEAGRPFMDLYGILAASDAAQAGVDPFVPDDFDPYRRPHVYTTWWLEIGRLGLDRTDTVWLGVILLGVMLATALVMVRPRTVREGITLALMLISPAFLLAVSRANNDLVVFVLMSGGLLCFRRDTWGWRALGVLLIAFSGVLKYYPVAALVVLLALRSRREFLGNVVICGLLFALAWPGLEPGFKSAARYMPHPDWLYAYGAPVFLRDLVIPGAAAWLGPAVLMGFWAAWVAWQRRAEPVAAPSSAERDYLVGATVLVGLFFLGSSYVYKLIFAVWLLPWLWQTPAEVPEARWRRVTLVLLLVVLWLEGVVAMVVNLAFATRPGPGLFLLKNGLLAAQLLTWAWVACLLRSLAILLLAALRRWWQAMGRAAAA